MILGLFGNKSPKEVPGILRLNGEEIPYQLHRSRRRSLSIQIAHEGYLVLRAPFRMSQKDIDQLIASKAGWITKKLQYVREQHQQVQALPPSWPVLGRLLSLRSSDIKHFRQTADELAFPKKWSGEDLYEKLQSWNDARAREAFPNRFEQVFRHCCSIEARLERYDPEFRLRRMKRSWGNCRGERITLNTELYKYPPELIDYVICHEICHLIHKDHGRGFYALQERLYPNWRQAREDLKQLSMQYARISHSSQPNVV